MNTFNIFESVTTRITVRGYKCKKLAFLKEYKNTITYAGADRIAAALTNTSENTEITHLYAYFTAWGNPGISANLEGGDPKKADRAAFVTGANNGNPGTAFGAIWVPVASSVGLSASSVDYQGNTITYSTIIPASVASDDTTKIGEFIADSSEIRAIGLASANVFSDRSKDIIFSLIDIPEAADAGNRQAGESFVIPSAGQVTIDYTLTFNA